MKFYCQSCGHPNEGYKAPNFCSECASPFGKIPVVQKQNPVSTATKLNLPPSIRKQLEASSEEIEEAEIPHIEKLAYSIQGRGTVRQNQTIGFETEQDRQNAIKAVRNNSSCLQTSSDGKIQAIGLEAPDEGFQIKPIQKIKGKKPSAKQIFADFQKDAGGINRSEIGGE